MNVVVTGCGLVSSLGLDVANACAAARAGIVRARSMDFYPVRFPVDGSVSGVVCHTVPLLTDGFEGEARLLRLIQGGLEDLIRQRPDAPWKKSRTAFYVSLPGAHRLLSGAELIADEHARENMIKAAKEVGNHTPDLERATRLLSQAARWAGWQGRPDIMWCTESGNTGVAEAIRQASDDLAKGVCDLAIVGGVDSLLDEDTLAWLELTGRLKTPDLASGLQPGEACGFLMLEPKSATSSKGVRTVARVTAVCFATEAKGLFSGEPSTGAALAESVAAAIMSGSDEVQGQVWLIHDLNGESYRAHEWGMGLFRLASLSAAMAEPQSWFPAASYGSTGAASGVAQACVAIRAFERKCAPRLKVGLSSSSDEGAHACIALAGG